MLNIRIYILAVEKLRILHIRIPCYRRARMCNVRFRIVYSQY